MRAVDQLELRRLLDRQVCGPGAFEDLVHVGGRAAEEIGQIHSVRHEPPAATCERNPYMAGQAGHEPDGHGIALEFDPAEALQGLPEDGRDRAR